MKYVSYYDTVDNKKENRGYVLSATNKMDYICTVLNRLGYTVEIVSASATANRKGCKGKNVQLTEKIRLRLLSCIGNGILPKRLLGRLWIRLQLFFNLLFGTKRGENVLVYHSLGYAKTIAFARKLKGFRLILEVEEIYADVNGRESDRKREYKVFSVADAYLFPTELLNEKINIYHKPYALIHGTYQVEPDRKCSVFLEDVRKDGKRKIHCVYAGTLDPRKGGATAAAAAKYLPPEYHIHILGFGSKEDELHMKTTVDALSQTCACSVSYDGLLAGEEYIRFIQSCDIGLSTQNPDAAFNATSFPSKILSYMANGLRVVSIRIPAVEGSAVGAYMYYYNRQTPEEIAKAIQSAEISAPYDSRSFMKSLDDEFCVKLEGLLKDW